MLLEIHARYLFSHLQPYSYGLEPNVVTFINIPFLLHLLFFSNEQQFLLKYDSLCNVYWHFVLFVGLHAEGSIMSNLFGLFFWDVIFMDVPDVFHSAYQTHPLDLYSTLFYSNRQSAIDLRLEEIKTATVEVCFSSHIFGPKILTINFKLTKILTRLLS